MKITYTAKQKEIIESLKGVKPGDSITIILNPAPGFKLSNVLEGKFSKHEKLTPYSNNRSIFLTRNEGSKEIEMFVSESNINRVLSNKSFNI